METVMWAAGRGHEEVLLALRQFHMVRHEVIERDGILFTPDLTDVAPGQQKIVEIKSTRKTAARFNQAEGVQDVFARQFALATALGNYLDQAKTYCAATGITRAEIDVLCIHGDYGGRCEECEVYVRENGTLNPRHQHGMATLHCYEAEWTHEELEQWWTERVMPRKVNYDLLRSKVEEIDPHIWTWMIQTANEGHAEIPIYELLELTEHPFEQVVGYPFECETCPILRFCMPPHMQALVAVLRAGKRTPEAPSSPELIGPYIEQLEELATPRPRKSKGNGMVEGTQITYYCSGPKPKHDKCPGMGHVDGKWLECQCSCPHTGAFTADEAEEAA